MVIVGTINTTFFPASSLSMIDVYAIKDVEKNRIECNNINLNLNGLDINTVPEPFSSLLQDQAETGELADSGSGIVGNTENRISDYKDLTFKCVNNNDNERSTSPTPPIPPPPPIDFLDLAVANTGSNNVSIRLGNGDGTFSPATPPEVTVGTTPASVAVGDFDNDGDLDDLAVANANSNNVSIRLGNGDGHLVQQLLLK